jgi:hypothetical protein
MEGKSPFLSRLYCSDGSDDLQIASEGGPVRGPRCEDSSHVRPAIHYVNCYYYRLLRLVEYCSKKIAICVYKLTGMVCTF